jgi:hypothetical protein
MVLEGLRVAVYGPTKDVFIVHKLRGGIQAKAFDALCGK